MHVLYPPRHAREKAAAGVSSQEPEQTRGSHPLPGHPSKSLCGNHVSRAPQPLLLPKNPAKFRGLRWTLAWTSPLTETGSPFSRRMNLCLYHSQLASPTVRTSDTLQATFLGVMLPTGGGVPFDVAMSCMNSFLWSPPRWTQPECQMVISSRPGSVPTDIIIRLLGFQSEQPT